jgi:crotonyl-CoA carboxylase/reductase
MLAESTRIWATRRTMAATASSPRPRRTSACPSPKRLTWEEAGASAAPRRRTGCWGGRRIPSSRRTSSSSGARRAASAAWRSTPRAQGGRAVAVVSDEAKREFCVKHGAAGVINRNDFKHWGPMPDTKDARRTASGPRGARAGKALWDARRADEPAHRVRASGRGHVADVGLSLRHGGMIVICAGTTGYNVTMDLRYHWMRQKRFQGSHLSNDEQAAAVTALVAGARDPVCRRPYVSTTSTPPSAHGWTTSIPTAIWPSLVNASQPGLGRA